MKIETFDFRDKNSLFGKMDPVHDSRVREIRTEGTMLYLVCDKIEDEDLAIPDGTREFGSFKEVEIEYEGVEPANIWLREKGIDRNITSEELFLFLKKKKCSLTMFGWAIDSDGDCLKLDIIIGPAWKYTLKIWLYPTKITYRWK